MMSKLITFLFSVSLAVILCGSALATVNIVHNPEMWLAAPLFGPNSELPSIPGGIPYTQPATPKGDPLGPTYLLGTTWYDYQHNGTIDKMIHLNDNGAVHCCWMNGLQAQALDRHIYYNYFDPVQGTPGWPDVGYQVDQGNRAGYTTIAAFSSGEAVVAYHATDVAGSDFNSEIAYDFLAGFGAFQLADIDNLLDWNETIWPHVAVCNQDFIHVASCENRTTSWQRIAYSRSEDGGMTYTSFANVDTVMCIAQTVAGSPVSNKVGIAYPRSQFDPLNLGPYDGLLVSQLNNGIALIESDDGVTWDFNDEQDITQLIEPDASYYPDSAYANGDTLRAYCDVSLLYDNDDYAHVAFTTRYLGFDARLASHPDSFAISGMSLDASIIWHWSEEHDTLTVVAEGWYDVGATNVGANEYRGAGAWRSTVDRPSLGFDPNSDLLYCLYLKNPEGDTSGGPVPSHGFGNGEVYCSVSDDGGLNWTQGVNLTNTPSPNAFPGECMDEDYPSLARTVNDTLHIFYVEDKDAGGVVMTAPQEGSWTENPVKYLKVPADLVPPGPPYVNNFNFHVVPGGGSGVQEPCLVDGTVPGAYALHQNYPNPFNPETTIRFDLAQDGPARIDIYNVTGQLIRRLVEADRQAGSYQVVWNGRNDDGQLVPSGIYFCRLTAGPFSQVRKMALIK
jgi:hypothetical protein